MATIIGAGVANSIAVSTDVATGFTAALLWIPSTVSFMPFSVIVFITVVFTLLFAAIFASVFTVLIVCRITIIDIALLAPIVMLYVTRTSVYFCAVSCVI
nr:hypothetical protein FVER53263_13423 [Fusarium verticillioides]